MPSQAQYKAIYKYEKKTYKRVPLNIRKEDYTIIKETADSLGMSVNGFIKEAINRYIASAKNEIDKLHELNFDMDEAQE